MDDEILSLFLGGIIGLLIIKLIDQNKIIILDKI